MAWRKLRATRDLRLMETDEGYVIVRVLAKDAHWARISDEYALLTKVEKQAVQRVE